MLEMSAHGVTKASTLERLCVDLGVAAEEVVAFGDMPNDVAMLQWAGTSYAMANAHPAAVAVAAATAPSHEDDGVAAVLSELFDLGPMAQPVGSLHASIARYPAARPVGSGVDPDACARVHLRQERHPGTHQERHHRPARQGDVVRSGRQDAHLRRAGRAGLQRRGRGQCDARVAVHQASLRPRQPGRRPPIRRLRHPAGRRGRGQLLRWYGADDRPAAHRGHRRTRRRRPVPSRHRAHNRRRPRSPGSTTRTRPSSPGSLRPGLPW